MTNHADNDAPRCGNCGHYEGPETGQGICYCNPPVPYPVQTAPPAIATPQGQAASAGIGVMPIRPPVMHDESPCGQWESRTDEGSPEA